MDVQYVLSSMFVSLVLISTSTVRAEREPVPVSKARRSPPGATMFTEARAIPALSVVLRTQLPLRHRTVSLAAWFDTVTVVRRTKPTQNRYQRTRHKRNTSTNNKSTTKKKRQLVVRTCQ